MSMPKEPRQLMINLMYLVLTALLALNVSNEILHAFKVINESVGSSNEAMIRTRRYMPHSMRMRIRKVNAIV